MKFTVTIISYKTKKHENVVVTERKLTARVYSKIVCPCYAEAAAYFIPATFVC